MKIEQIYEVIAKEGFTALALQTIDNYIKEIQDYVPQENTQELITDISELVGQWKYQIAPENRDNADVNLRGNGITNGDALAIQKYLLHLIPTLPES